MAANGSTAENLLPLTGGCSCGLIRYQLTRYPILVHCCYCAACQRQTGSAFALNAVVEASALELLASSAASPTDPGPEPVPIGLTPAFASLTGAAPPTGSSAAPALVCIPTESQLGQTVAHCPACHTGLWNYYADAGPTVAYVRVGTLDRARQVEPDVHIYTRSRRAFLAAIDDGKPQFDDYYPSRDALVTGDALERLQALKPVVNKWREEMKATLSK
ncbi:hypothetical protein B0J13DRAFT_559446 [Dactylonectria estremocensis]|uniref:CENP-V/GFA domain-containing protein n=1 Tax=Dactylonectria estremocensis TaxID=1079267 RepID=A0A9P9EGZ7_9HYPO|nr:hypothetical protein B0J13DRAFT_559446 [Dactylonectria estremocensis]